MNFRNVTGRTFIVQYNRRRKTIRDINRCKFYGGRRGDACHYRILTGEVKSTLAKLLMGINEATGGKIILDGQDITSYTIDKRAQAGMGFAFQQPPRFKGMTVKRLLSLAAGRELDDTTCCELLSSVGLCAKEYINREADATLSAER